MTSMLASQIEAKLATDAGAVGMTFGLDPVVVEKVMRGNAIELFGLRDRLPGLASAAEPAGV